MRLELTDGTEVFIEQNNIKLQEIDNDTHIVGGQTLYGITEDTERFCINPDISTTDVLTQEYDAETDTYNWVSINEQIEWDSVPKSMYADDTFNFENFSLNHIFIVFLSIFIIFCVFKRR